VLLGYLGVKSTEKSRLVRSSPSHISVAGAWERQWGPCDRLPNSPRQKAGKIEARVFSQFTE